MTLPLPRSPRLPRNDAIDLLFQQYGNLVRRRCRGILRDDEAAEDAVQTTFLNLLKHHDRHGALPGPAEILPLLYTISTRCCFSMYRQQKRCSVGLDAVEIPDLEADSLESRVVAADLLRRVLADLPEPLFEAAWFWYVDGMTQDEIAGSLGVGRRAVAARLARFRKMVLARRKRGRLP